MTTPTKPDPSSVARAMAALRWKNKTKKQRSEHARMMALARHGKAKE